MKEKERKARKALATAKTPPNTRRGVTKIKPINEDTLLEYSGGWKFRLPAVLE